MSKKGDLQLSLIQHPSIQQQLQEQQYPDTDSQEQQLHFKQEQLRNLIMQKKRKRKINSKVIVGSRFSCDVSEFFKFNKKRQSSRQDGRRLSLVQQFSMDYISWLVMTFYLLVNAVVPPWIAKINSNRLIRNSWLFFLQSFLIIPFVMYQKRICKQQDKHKYSIKYIFSNIKKIYISAASLSIFQIVLWLCFDWTYLSHSLILGGLSNFFLSLVRSFNRENHRLQPGGQILIIFGIISILIDAYTLNVQELPQSYFHDLNHAYANKKGYQRLIADLLALSVSYIVAQLSKLSIDIKNCLPPFLSIMCVNIFVCINTALAGFFLVGNDFDFTPGYGWFSLFTNAIFTSFLFETTLISFGIFLSYALITKLYPNPTIPSMFMVFDLYVSSFFMEVYGIQHMPGSYSAFGFMLLIPGMMMILVGQHIYVQAQKNDETEDQKKLSKMITQHEIIRQTRLTKKQSMQRQKTNLQKLSVKKSRMQSNKMNSPQFSPQLKKENESQKISYLQLNPVQQIVKQEEQKQQYDSSDSSDEEKRVDKRKEKIKQLQSLKDLKYQQRSKQLTEND